MPVLYFVLLFVESYLEMRTAICLSTHYIYFARFWYENQNELSSNSIKSSLLLGRLRLPLILARNTAQPDLSRCYHCLRRILWWCCRDSCLSAPNSGCRMCLCLWNCCCLSPNAQEKKSTKINLESGAKPRTNHWMSKQAKKIMPRKRNKICQSCFPDS